MIRSHRLLLGAALYLVVPLSLQGMSHAHRGPTSQRVSTKHSRGAQKPASQRVIDPERATQIQNALIKNGYLSGAPTGQWDSATQAAMQKLQSDNGWQTKLIPDSRAIIKLGLGPTQEPGTTSARALPYSNPGLNP